MDSFATNMGPAEFATAQRVAMSGARPTVLPASPPQPPSAPPTAEQPSLLALDVGMAEKALADAPSSSRLRLYLAGASAVVLALVVGLSAGLSGHKSGSTGTPAAPTHTSSSSSTLPPLTPSSATPTATTSATSLPSNVPLALGNYTLSDGQATAASNCTHDGYACNALSTGGLYTVGFVNGTYQVNGINANRVSQGDLAALTFQLFPSTPAIGVNGCAFSSQAQATLLGTENGFNATVTYTYTAAADAQGCTASFQASPCVCVYDLNGALMA